MNLSEKLSKTLVNYLEKGKYIEYYIHTGKRELAEFSGVKTPEQVLLSKDHYFLRTLGLSTEEISLIKDTASSLLLPQGILTADEVYEREMSFGKLTTGCKAIDEYLNGGLRIGTISEIFGESGCGKTQIALQITSRCWDKGAVYISTENVFPSKRLQQMFSNINNEQSLKADISKYGEKIFVMNIIELDELKRCIVGQLPRLLEVNRSIALIVIDSITGPFRSEFHNDMKSRAQHLKEIGMTLLNIAVKHDVAVLTLNQVLSTMDSNDYGVIPCLGLTWSNLLTSRFKVEKTGNYCRASDVDTTKHSDVGDMMQIRRMKILASPELPSDKNLEYVITQKGVIGLT